MQRQRAPDFPKRWQRELFRIGTECGVDPTEAAAIIWKATDKYKDKPDRYKYERAWSNIMPLM